MSGRRIYSGHINLLVITPSVGFSLAVLGAAGYLISTRSQPVQATSEPVSLMAEGNVKTGTLNHNPEERQKELNSAVEGGMLTFSISATPFMKNGTSTTNLLAESPPGNTMRFAVTIEKDDTGESVYQSGYLDPEQYVDSVPLDVELSEGEYPCTAYFNTYRIDDSAYVRRVGAQITLYVPD